MAIKTKDITANSVLHELIAAPIGGEIFTNKCVVIDQETIEIHCWDGRRYLLSVKRLPDSHGYSTSTGEIIPWIDL